MSIFSALGLAVLIIVLKTLVPSIFAQLSSTIIAFLHGAQVSADIASQLSASAALIKFPTK
jgi:hypothetical protein